MDGWMDRLTHLQCIIIIIIIIIINIIIIVLPLGTNTGFHFSQSSWGKVVARFEYIIVINPTHRRVAWTLPEL